MSLWAVGSLNILKRAFIWVKMDFNFDLESILKALGEQVKSILSVPFHFIRNLPPEIKLVLKVLFALLFLFLIYWVFKHREDYKHFG